jgi:putative CocE/NonD family hydrolase
MAERNRLSRPQYKVVVDKDVPMRTRDGVTLRADIYRPDAPGRFPVLLSRLPYNKNLRSRPGDIDYFVERGYVVIMQDVRGRFASEGDEYYPIIFEARDGYDAVEWAAALLCSNGNVGVMGQSYLGATQYQLAPTRPPHLRAAFPVSAPTDPYHNFAYHTGGAFELGWRIPNAIFMARDAIERTGRNELLPLLERELASEALPLAQRLTDEAYRRLPLSFWGDLLRPVARYVADFLRHPEDGPYWWATNTLRQLNNINVPMFHVTSWYDLFLHSTLAAYTGLTEEAMTPEARSSQRLLIGPWAHIFPYTVPTSGGTGDIDFGPRALIDLHEIQLRWFDYWLKGYRTGIMEEPRVRLFVMGENTWREENEWPLARTRYTNYYLHSAGAANTLDGDGSLSTDGPGDEPPDQYDYDPANPVPTAGGNSIAISSGVQDQRPIERRRDVLVYTSAPLAEPLEITGPIIMRLYAATSAPDTDFTAKLVDVRPDGYAQNLADGIIRARYRRSTFRGIPVEPDKPYDYTVDLWATSHVLMPGHRLRVEISSSNFPRFDRNLNTGEDPATATRMQVAHQTVFHNSMFPSHIVLPVIPR